ncbi:hypothetical protein Tco_1329336 [Tanacetum coccineum]
MMGDRSRLMNFVKKFTRTVRFGNDHFGAIIGYGDYVIGNIMISKVYYVEGLGHNLFSVKQFYDFDLEVAFRKHTCYVCDTDGVELIKGSCGSNLYTISVEDMMKSSPICLLSKASKNKSWQKLLLLLVTPKTDPSFTLVITKPHMSWCMIRSLILPFSESLVLFVTLQMTARILENYNQQLILEFLLLSEPMAPVQLNTGPTPTFLTPGQISSGLVPNSVPSAPYVPPTNKELEILFQLMFDEYLEPPHVERPVSPTPAVPVPVNSASTPSSTTIDQDAPPPSHSPSSLALQSLSLHQGVAAGSTIIKDNPFAPVDNNPFVNVFTPEPSSEASSSSGEDVSSADSNEIVSQPHIISGMEQGINPLDNVLHPLGPVLQPEKQLVTMLVVLVYYVLSYSGTKELQICFNEDL